MKYGKQITLLFAIVLVSGVAKAQKNTTKVGSSLGFLSLMYGVEQERAITDRMTVQTQLRFKPKQELPVNEYLGAEYEGNEYNPWLNPVFSGWSNITELRIYGKNKGALNGFYWGPYLNYTNHKVVSDEIYAEFTDNDGTTYFGDVQQTLRLVNIGGGLSIGTQKVWDSGLTLNWTILGIGVNGYTLSSEIVARNTSGNFDFRDYREEVEEAYLTLEEVAPVEIELEKERAKISASMPSLHFRMGLSIGFGY